MIKSAGDTTIIYAESSSISNVPSKLQTLITDGRKSENFTLNSPANFPTEMLTGRESLIRLIGKRRRFLPNLSGILSSSSSQCLNQSKEVDETNIDVPKASNLPLIGEIKCPVMSGDVDEGYVTCPVCSNKIRGDDSTVNSHLDLCLARGTKRKLSQRTLLQFNFCSRLKSETLPDEVCVGTEDIQIDSNAEQTLNDFPQPARFNANQISYENKRQIMRVCESDTCKSSLTVGVITQHDTHVLMEENSPKENCNIMVDSPLLPLSNVSPNVNMEETSSLLSGMALETYIVGRKFVDEAEVVCGASISLLRDPANIKDPNAIKVISADSDDIRVLGFLPRALAQHLSPLIDKYEMNFEGLIISAPKFSLDVVPIKIMCQNTISCDEVGKDDLSELKSLCENAVLSANAGKTSPPIYAKYQQNFHLMIEEALRSNLHLFTDDEKFFLGSFGSMSDDGRRLFVRLYQRKGPWFRVSNLSYSEILDHQQAVKELSEASFLYSLGHENEVDGKDLKELLNIFTVRELSDLLRTTTKESCSGMRKKDLVESLHSLYKDGMCPLLPSLILEIAGTCIRISSTAEILLWRIQRLFFLNGEQDLSAFLLVDMGKVKYPEYKCIISTPVFPNRNDFLTYEEAIEVAQIMDQALDEDNSVLILGSIEVAESQLSRHFKSKNQIFPQELLATFLQHFSAPWVYSKVVLLGVSFFEQERRYQDAIRLLKLLLNNFTCDGRRGYWTLRLSIDLEHVGCIEESLSVAEDGVLDPWVRAGSKIALQRRVLRLCKPPRRWKVPSYPFVKRKVPQVHILGRPLGSKVGTKSRFYGENGDQCGVEELALQFYAGEGGGWQGVHSESGIWLTIYGLLMWDIIFADVPNVFHTKFQNAPLDMETDNFYVARTSLIESHLQKIHDGEAEEILIMSWESHLGTVCRGVNWERHTLAELGAAVTCIGGPCLSNICRMFAQDYRSWSSGMPDLLLWRFHGDYTGEAKLVEVKGPKDRLSEQQRAWLLSLMDCGFSAEVCKVNPPST